MVQSLLVTSPLPVGQFGVSVMREFAWLYERKSQKFKCRMLNYSPKQRLFNF